MAPRSRTTRGGARPGADRPVRGEVRFDAGSRATYSTDASNYRQVPIGVVLPRDAEDVLETVRLCRRYDAPITSRGGGTSLAGQTTNEAVIIDCSKYMDRVLVHRREARTATVQPGAFSTRCAPGRRPSTD